MIWLSRLLDKSVPISRYADEAANWGTCAMGEFAEKLGAIPRFHLLATNTNDGRPRDKCLLRWGDGFGLAVEANDRKTALQLYRRMFNYITKGGVKK